MGAGKIKQDTLSELRRFKWGVSRILMECDQTPLIIPIWIKGTSSLADPRDKESLLRLATKQVSSK